MSAGDSPGSAEPGYPGEVLLLAALACRSPDPGTETGTVPPFTWHDTATVPGWEPVVSLREPPRNVLMISIDTLRRDAIGRYGGGADTPFLDQLLAEGVTLDDHLQCANWTFPSTTCTLTGRYPEELRVLPRLTFTPEPLPSGLGMLADRLGEAGLHPMLVSGNPWLSPIANNAQGYVAVSAPEEDTTATEVWHTGEQLLLDAVDAGAGRWFLHLHLMEPHAPYDPPAIYLDALDALPPAPWNLADREIQYGLADDWPTLSAADQALLEAHLRARYRGEVRWLDDQLRLIWTALDQHGWLDDTLVVVWTDHGEQFWEHGRQSHAWQLFAEENDAVALFWSRGLEPVAWEGPTSSVDLMPTVLTALGLPVPAEVVGLPVGAAAPGRPRFASADGRSGIEQAVVRDGWKLRYHWSGLAQRFDRPADPGETTDRWDPEDPDARALWEILVPRTEALAPLASGRTPVVPPGL